MRCFVSEAKIRESAGGAERKRGFILLSLLLFLMVCSGIALCYGRSVYQEAEAAREFLCRKQLESIAQSFMYTALRQEKETEITNAVYTLNPLQPGNDEVKRRKFATRLQRLTDFFQKKFEKIWSGRGTAVLLQPISPRKRA